MGKREKRYIFLIFCLEENEMCQTWGAALDVSAHSPSQLLTVQQKEGGGKEEKEGKE